MPIPTKVMFNPENDQTMSISGLTDEVTGTKLNAATVTGTLKDHRGNPVAGADGIVMAKISGDGNYRGQVEETFNPLVGSGYTWVVDSVEGGVTGHWEIPAEVVERVA